MNENNTAADRNDAADRDAEQKVTDHPAGALRLLPAVTFGVRAAALVGLAVPIGIVIGSLGGGAGEAVAVTTCCP
ncbi:hypothetical protein [Phytohabitans suffuscus]|uniref:Uncharacterized protein n=1 Tax=Phytohabitans suffuscus TaxID=624315 RepID=A0A6F8Z0S2_9ACTN|nr:hypothetical protein [Phytohabitans suffuscus]BCB91987.1 hypothetical protein Psuf_093000 [Phytohabitans suffuscus]